MKRIGIVLLFLSLMVGTLFAQSKTEPVVVASADGATKEEAVKMALRSVVEQAFGVFVASNTSILNDEILQDEVATISSGNIKEYKVVSSNFVNDRYFVTVQATVCLKKLLDYSREHAAEKGVTVQINGEQLNNDFQLARLNYELNKKAEFLAISNMIKQLEELTKSVPLLDYELELSEPIKTTYSPRSSFFNELTIAGCDGGLALGMLNLSDHSIRALLTKFEGYWEILGRLTPKFNDNTAKFFDIFLSTMEAVAVTQSEVQEAEKYNFELYPTPKMFYDKHLFSYTLRNPVDAYKYALYGLDLLFVQRVKISDDKANVTSALVVPCNDSYVSDAPGSPDGLGNIIDINYVFPSGYSKVPTFGLYYRYPSKLFLGERKVKKNGIKFHYKSGDRIGCHCNGYLYTPQSVFHICIPQEQIGNYKSFSYSYQYPTQENLDMYNRISGALYGDCFGITKLYPVKR